MTFATDHETAAAISRGETNAQRGAGGRPVPRARQHRGAGVDEHLRSRALDDVFAAVRADTTYR